MKVWAEYLFYRENRRGLVHERWWHGWRLRPMADCRAGYGDAGDPRYLCLWRGTTVGAEQVTDNAWRFAQGGRIDRSEPLEFTFDGVRHRGFRGRHARFGTSRQRSPDRRSQLQAASSTWPPGASGTEEPNAIVRDRQRCPHGPQCQGDAGRADRPDSRRAASTAGRAPASTCTRRSSSSRHCCRRASITRHSSGRAGGGTSRGFAGWRASVLLPACRIPTYTRRDT